MRSSETERFPGRADLGIADEPTDAASGRLDLRELRHRIAAREDAAPGDVRHLLDGSPEERTAAQTALLRMHLRRAAAAAGELTRLDGFASPELLETFRTLVALSDDELPLLEAHKALGIRAAAAGRFEEAMRYLHSVGSNVEMSQRRHDARATQMLRFFADPEIDCAVASLAAQLAPVTAVPPATGPRRLALITSGLVDDNAQAAVTVRMAEGFRALGYEVRIISSEYGDSSSSGAYAYARAAGFEIRLAPRDASFRDRAEGLRAIFQAYPVHGALYVPTPADIVAKLVAEVGMAPVQFYANTADEPFCGKFRYVFQSLSREQTLTTQWPGKSVYVGAFVANAPQIAEARPLERAALGVPEEAVLLGTFGRLVKCSPAYLEAVRSILDAAPEAVLLIAGPSVDPSFDPIGPAIDAFPARDRIRVLGPRQREIPALLRTIDCYLDTFPRPGAQSVLEAMSAGLPVVATRRTHHPAIDRLGVGPNSSSAETLLPPDAELAEAEDVDGYVQLALSYVRDEVRRRTTGAALRAFVERTHGFDAFMQRIDAYVREAIEELALTHPTSAEPADLAVAG